ncbi:MAG: hypothetical protein LBJ89_01345, partial [Holosporales bacterium]|jgi:hypothetical protein|nr:hypothetical protein [Holosporales bacterium]
LFAGCNRQDSLSENQKSEIERIVRDTLDKVLESDPGKFVAAIDKAMQQQQREAAQKVEQNATESQQKFWGSKLILGSPGAKLRLAVFIDPRDPVSQKFYAEVMIPIVKERSDVCFFLIPVSIYGAQDEKPTEQASLIATKALIASTWQSPEKALELWKSMLTIHQEYPMTLLLRHAREAGLDVDKLKSDIESEVAQRELIANGQLAVDVGIPIQLPVIFILGQDKRMSIMPPFVKDRMVAVLNAAAKGEQWQQGISELSAAPDASENKPAESIKEKEQAPASAAAPTK